MPKVNVVHHLTGLRCTLAVLAGLLGVIHPARAQDAVPTVSVTAPTTVFIGANFNLSVSFNNASPDQPGYGPFVDLAYEATGVSGRASGAPLDGVTIAPSGAVTYLGQPVTYQILTFDDTANGGQGVIQPYASASNGGPVYLKTTDFGSPGRFVNGDKILVAQLPFGSFTPNQPAATLTVNASLSNLANLNAPMALTALGGFQFGNDPLNDPATDPTLFGTPSDANPTVSGTLITLQKIYLGPEDETATGPNFKRQYRIDVTVAPGQTVSSLAVKDVLPDGMQFVRLDSVTGNGMTSYTTDTLPSTTVPGGTLQVTLNQVIGTASGASASVLFTYFVPRLDANGTTPVLDPTTGPKVPLQNQAGASGSWTPIDPRDPQTIVLANETSAGVLDAPPEHTLTAKSIAIQKSVALVNDTGATGYTPGDTVEYTLQFQVSDYFAFQNIKVEDVLSDGQHFDPTFTPTLTVTEHGSTTAAAAMQSANFTVTPNYTPGGAPTSMANYPPIDGTTALEFRVSDELVSRGFTVAGAGAGQLLGGGVDSPFNGPYNDPPLPFGGTIGTVTFRAVVQDTFNDNFPSGTPNLKPRDSLTDNVTISGDILNVSTLAPDGDSQNDDSHAGFSIVPSSLLKKVIFPAFRCSATTQRLGKTSGVTATLKCRWK
jgi:fimbrial isopeptide formation D2 family protein